VNRAILQHNFFLFGDIGADATIAILLPTLKRLFAMEKWTGAQRAFAVKAFNKNGDSFVMAQREFRRRFHQPMPSPFFFNVEPVAPKFRTQVLMAWTDGTARLR
jgi:hypothetical protein